MNIEISVIISVVAGIISVAVAYGVVKTKVGYIEQRLAELGNTENTVRKYLFSPDGMTIYSPMVQCDKQHLKLDKKLDSMEEKIDTILHKIAESQ